MVHEVRHAKRIAAKQHRCEWCGEYIEPGETYFVYVGKYHGHWQTTKMHSECWDAAYEEWSKTKKDTFERRVNKRPMNTISKSSSVVGVESLFERPQPET